MRVALTRRGHGTGPMDVSGIILTLSRRNLESLTKMLDEGRTAGALTGRDEHVEILVQAQEDEFHYADREAGPMSWEQR